jgi:hypothetical protein
MCVRTLWLVVLLTLMAANSAQAAEVAVFPVAGTN